jgi:hypothetical protein
MFVVVYRGIAVPFYYAAISATTSPLPPRRRRRRHSRRGTRIVMSSNCGAG